MAFNGSQTRSFYKSPGKNDLEHTRYTTRTGTGFGTTVNFGAKQSKLDQAYWNARNMIDELIGQAQEKRDMSRMAIKNVGDTNQYLMDTWNFQEQVPVPPFYHVSAIQVPQQEMPMASQLDLDKTELLQLLQTERQKNQFLQRKCRDLSEENSVLKESQLEYSKLLQSQHQPVYQPIQAPPTRITNNQGSRQLFAELQNLKLQNEKLRQQTIQLLKITDY